MQTGPCCLKGTGKASGTPSALSWFGAFRFKAPMPPTRPHFSSQSPCQGTKGQACDRGDVRKLSRGEEMLWPARPRRSLGREAAARPLPWVLLLGPLG